MRAVVQRVRQAGVTVEGRTVSSIQKGYLVLLGVEQGDTMQDMEYLADKIVNLRVFEDEQGKMNLSVKDTGGEILVVSQFTLCADCRKGRRPSFVSAAEPDKAEKYYEEFCNKVSAHGIAVKKGVFGAHMEVDLVNDGPVTILLDSKKTF
ncbi:MAG: D-tyrosyl-tRNA(Tyr) deacylase [Clostridiales bacterium]|nr:D-tyrosyl-tRNA(Tyr) deacylase [Clostridiales bacterium]